MHIGVFLIQSASFIHLVCLCASLSTTFPLSQSMTWCSYTARAVMADLWVTLLSLALETRVSVPAVKESTSFLCSLIIRPNFLPISIMYDLKQFFQGTWSINWSIVCLARPASTLSQLGRLGKSAAPTFYFGTPSISPKLNELGIWNLAHW